jgi:hypothetical protein
MRVFGVIGILALVLAAPAGAARISAADRAEINRTLDDFVNSAIKRKDVRASYELVTPNMRYGVTRADWNSGDLPVYPFPARGSSFHNWTVDFVKPNHIGIELLLSSSKRKDDSIQYFGEMKKLHGHWLVDSLSPSATFGGGGVAGPHDYAAGAGGSGGGGNGGITQIGSDWIALPAALLAGSILLLLGGLGYVLVRNRRRVKKAGIRPLEPIVVRKRDAG